MMVTTTLLLTIKRLQNENVGPHKEHGTHSPLFLVLHPNPRQVSNMKVVHPLCQGILCTWLRNGQRPHQSFCQTQLDVAIPEVGMVSALLYPKAKLRANCSSKGNCTKDASGTSAHLGIDPGCLPSWWWLHRRTHNKVQGGLPSHTRPPGSC
jgi:hypothetical protein